jgi:dTDP-glucose 4,6-dehydratase
VKSILVTGGAGFIGANFINYILKIHPHLEIICIDKLTYAGNLENLSDVISKPNFRFIKGDITDTTLLEEIFKDNSFDTVINFAAESHVDKSIETPLSFINTNYFGVYCLLEVVRKYQICRFHQVSTDEVYGDLPIESKDSFDENSILKPSSPYSASKAAADLLILAYHRTYGLDVTISRSTNNFGKYQFPEKLIPLVIEKAYTNKSIPLYGSGLNVRDWIHVDDHCSAIVKIINNGVSGEIYNVGSNNEIPNIDLVKKILMVLNKPQSFIKPVTDRVGHDLKYSVNVSKIKAIGWIDSGMFQEKLEETIKWNLSKLGD